MSRVDRFVADCRAAFAKTPTQKALQEILARAASDPVAVLNGLGEPALVPARVDRVEEKSGREER
jgi:hypothetical protein